MLKRQMSVSVVMCTYNGEMFLRQQMDSIIAQTYPISEIIVQDDGSTDHTIDIIREYMAVHKNIKLFQNEHNLGFNKNFFSATKRASGDLIALCDQDDVWFDDKIKLLVENIGDKSMCFSYITRGAEQSTATVSKYRFSAPYLIFQGIVGHSMLLKKEFVQNSENWLPQVSYDCSLSIMAHLKGNGIACVAQPLVFHRMHKGEVSISQQSPEGVAKWQPYIYGWRYFKSLKNNKLFLKYYSSLFDITNSRRQPLVKEILKCLISPKKTDTLRLCLICFKHRKEVYSGTAEGFIGGLRGFFFPAIWAFYINKNYFSTPYYTYDDVSANG